MLVAGQVFGWKSLTFIPGAYAKHIRVVNRQRRIVVTIRRVLRNVVLNLHGIQVYSPHTVCTKIALLCEELLTNDILEVGGHRVIVLQPVPFCLGQFPGFCFFLDI